MFESRIESPTSRCEDAHKTEEDARTHADAKLQSYGVGATAKLYLAGSLHAFKAHGGEWMDAAAYWQMKGQSL